MTTERPFGSSAWNMEWKLIVLLINQKDYEHYSRLEQEQADTGGKSKGKSEK
jgi:hypothetical protein